MTRIKRRRIFYQGVHQRKKEAFHERLGGSDSRTPLAGG
jgi:hypothetical protein